MNNEEKREAIEELIYAVLSACGISMYHKDEIAYVQDATNDIMEVFKCE